MRVTLSFTDSHARDIKYFLRQKYNSKAELPKLIKIAVQNEVYTQAKRELDIVTREALE